MAVIEVLYKKTPTKSTRLTSNRVITEYTATYLIVTDDPNKIPTDGPDRIINQAIAGAGGRRLPKIREVYQYGSEINLLARCVSHGELTRNPNSLNRYTVDVTWNDEFPDDGGSDEDGETDPDTIYQRVEIEFQETQVPGRQFRYLGASTPDGGRFGTWPGINDEVSPAHQPLNNIKLKPGSTGPIRNTAGSPKLRNVRQYRHILRVTNFTSAWSSQFTEARNAWNSQPVRIVEIDDTHVLFDETYPALSLNIINVNKRTVEYFGRNILEMTWVIEYDPNGYIIEQVDSGTQALFIAGAKDPVLKDSGGNPATIRSDDQRLKSNPTGLRDLNVSSEILLNGEGVERSYANTPGVEGPIILNFIDESSPVIDFNLLPVSASFTPSIASVLPDPTGE